VSTLQADPDTHQDVLPVRQDGRQDGHQEPHQERQDGRQDVAGPPAGEWLPIAEAARRLGVSADAIRRRVRRRTLKARRIKATHGGADPYLVWLEEPAPRAHQDTHQDGRQVRQDTHQDSRQTPGERQDGHQDTHQDAARTLALAQARAAEMATYSQQLLAPYVKRIEEQAEEIGTLRERTGHLQAERDAARAELEQARARIAELEAPPAPASEAERALPPEPEPRRWWRRAWGWLAAG
jgi:hypothetical protein